MPLKINVGLSRKVGEANYGSRGASIHIEMEADPALVSDPGKFQQRIRQLFCLVRASLAEELNGTSNGAGQAHANGSSNGGTETPAAAKPVPRPATQSQIKALYALTKAQRVQLVGLLRERFHVARPEDLSIREASALIDSLKSADRRQGG